MSEISDSSTNTRPSAFGAFFNGAISGLISGAVMALIVAGVTAALPLVGIGTFAAGATFGSVLVHTLGSAGPLMTIASTLFGGTMGAKRALFDAPSAGHARSTDTVVPVPVMTAGAAQSIAPTVALADEAYDQAPTKNWVASTGRGDDSKARIEQILQNGALGDKDRAAAILASREATSQDASRA